MISGWVVLLVALSGVLVASFCVARDARKKAFDEHEERKADVEERDSEIASLKGSLADLRQHLSDRSKLEESERERAAAINNQVEKDEAWRAEERQRQEQRHEEAKAWQVSEAQRQDKESRIEEVIRGYLAKWNPKTDMCDFFARLTLFTRCGGARLKSEDEIMEACNGIRMSRGHPPDFSRSNVGAKGYLEVFARHTRDINDSLDYLDFMVKNRVALGYADDPLLSHYKDEIPPAS